MFASCESPEINFAQCGVCTSAHVKLCSRSIVPDPICFVASVSYTDYKVRSSLFTHTGSSEAEGSSWG